MSGTMRKKLSITVQVSVLARAAPPCEVCLRPTSFARFAEVDRRVGQFAHIRAVSKGGPRYDPAYPVDKLDEPDNLFWSCTDCHQIVDLTESWELNRLLTVLNENRRSARAGGVTIEGEIDVSGEFVENVTG